MALPHRFAFRALNELSLQTSNLSRLRLALVDLRIHQARAAKVGHNARTVAFGSGTAATFLAILGAAPADRWQYGWSLVGVLVAGALALLMNRCAYLRQVREDKGIDRDVEKAKLERAIILDETGFSDNYRDCMMLHAAVEAASAAGGDSEDRNWAKKRVDFWEARVTKRLEQARAAMNLAKGDERLDLEHQIGYLNDALVAAGGKAQLGNPT